MSPVERMRPNERCWCHSGLKWKNCHKIRERLEPINIFDRGASMRETFADGFCLHSRAIGEACGGAAVASHTIQRRGGLAAIAEDQHVISNRFEMDDLIKNSGEPAVRRVGIRKASTFPGFCAKHDFELFEPIEKPGAHLDKRAAFLLSYRAICMEYFKKKAAVETLPILKLADSGRPFPVQAQIQNYCAVYEQGTALGMRDIARFRSVYDSCMLDTHQGGFKYSAIFFDKVLPIVLCSAWLVETDFHGNWLQKLGTNSEELELVAVNVTTIGDRTAALFGWVGGNAGPAQKFVESFHQLLDARKSSAIASMGFEHSENVYMRPSWWESLSESKKRALLNRVLNGTPRRGRQENALVDDQLDLISADVIDTIEHY